MTRTLAALLLVAASVTVAGAENPEEAARLSAEGSELFARGAYALALPKFEAALREWGSPLIRYNLALTKIELDRIVEATEDLDAALSAGADAFTPADYRKGLTYQRLLHQRVGRLEVTCGQPAASVQLDGKRWFTCPGTKSVRILAGEHSIVAEAKGYLTVSRPVVVGGDKTVRERVALIPLAKVTKYVYSTSPWIPWTVAGTGAALGLGGVAVWIDARFGMDDWNNRFNDLCGRPEMPGCSENLTATTPERLLADELSSVQRQGQIGVGMMIAGGAVALAGTVWIVLNRPQPIVPRIEAAPTSDGASVRASWRF
jgi:hypothetical protein